MNPWEEASTVVARTQPEVETPQMTTESIRSRVRKIGSGVSKKPLALVLPITQSPSFGAMASGKSL